MPKFRKKPVVVEAVRWDPKAGHSAVEPTAPERGSLEERGVVQTAGGPAFVFAGDWLITEPDGRGHYPCRPDIFAATYDPLPDDNNGPRPGESQSD